MKDKEFYIWYEDIIGKARICDCEKCRERGEFELFVDDFITGYSYYPKQSQIHDIKCFTDSVEEFITAIVENYNKKLESNEFEKKYLQSIIDLVVKNPSIAAEQVQK